MCTVQGCSNGGVIRKGLCPKHYFRMKRHGSLTGGRTPEGEPMAFLMSSVGYAGSDCLLWPYAKDKAGYAKIYNEGHMSNAHRLMCRLSHGEPPEPKSESRHTCGKGHLGCINPKHLEWGSRLDNMKDRVRDGGTNRGAATHNAKLTGRDVIEIYALKGSSQTIVGTRYGVSRTTVRDIWNGRSWSWLTSSNVVDGPVGAC